jgi:hypothetical protein
MAGTGGARKSDYSIFNDSTAEILLSTAVISHSDVIVNVK